MADNTNLRHLISFDETFAALSKLNAREMRDLVTELAACIPTDGDHAFPAQHADDDAEAKLVKSLEA